ncbi:unnamed protein product [Arabidopsis thaliana]|uniref:Uncharacterized protein n=1 Tax=Arabidopsis thaliana TaxID=3702 RepID=A0A5S9X189_ARATH|nr:unnamed protein product [Arabidopsis thaliana]
MAENVGSDSSEFESISSSQKSYLKNCPFAGHEDLPTKSTDSDNTEVLGNQISPAVVKTPILSFSSPTSLDSINDDVFRTPPENASLSSAAESEPRVGVSEIKLQGGSNLTTPFSMAETTLVSSSPSLPAENVRVSESNLKSSSSTAKTTPVSASPSVNARVSESNLNSSSSTTPVSVSPSEKVRVFETTPVSASPSEKVRVFETKCHSDSGDSVPLSSSPPSVAADDVRVPAKHLDSDSSPPTAIGRTMVLVKQRISASDNSASSSASEGTKVSKTENSGEVLPFKEIIEALLRNSGEKLNERDDKVSYVEILKQCGLKFPK